MARINEIEALVAQFDKAIETRIRFRPIPFPAVDVLGATLWPEPSGGYAIPDKFATTRVRPSRGYGHAALSRVEASVGMAELSRVQPSLGKAVLDFVEAGRGGRIIGVALGLRLEDYTR